MNVIIIGGGAAGLMAARELSGHCEVTVLEARPVTGGRIHTIRAKKSPLLMEAGAEFVHGNLPLTLGLLKEAGIAYHSIEGTMYRRKNGRLEEESEIVEGWDELLRKMKELETDTTLYNFLENHFAGETYTALRQQAIAFAGGFDIADASKASVKALYKEWNKTDPEDNYLLPQGYGALIHFLQEECEKNGCRIVTNQLVKQIDWEKHRVTVVTADGHRYHGEKLIVTVPLGVLWKAAAKASINFTPPIDEYIKVSKEIGFGTVIKIVLLFRQRFWKEDAGFVLTAEPIPTWWTRLPDTVPVLTGWLGGPPAERWSKLEDKELLEKALLSLSVIFEKPVSELQDNLEEAHVFNWQRDDYALGAYSYSMPGTTIARDLLNTPIDDTIFFAGEGVYEGSSAGTVEAALMSGKETAGRMLEIIQK